MPARSKRPACARIPAVSTSRTGTPLIATVSSIVSRVVPGVSETIARSSPSKALSSDDLPAFGGPTIATVSPSRTSRPRSPSQRSRSSAAARLATSDETRPGSGSATSSGKSIAAASSSSSVPTRARNAPTSAAKPPPRLASAARAAARVSASMTAATASAACSSILPLRKARRVNSRAPPGARRRRSARERSRGRRSASRARASRADPRRCNFPGPQSRVRARDRAAVRFRRRTLRGPRRAGEAAAARAPAVARVRRRPIR